MPARSSAVAFQIDVRTKFDSLKLSGFHAGLRRYSDQFSSDLHSNALPKSFPQTTCPIADRSSAVACPPSLKVRFCVTHRTSNGSNVSSLCDAWRSDTSAGDRFICD
ncbi:hypothetical protein DPMN_187457 [Dreissena polymorpha]|uniref:Uncharacterized protein n=1 Tax=Dreissena polymorpha TaxID=45954 RepID=A0A9D4I7I5_DREPO|nr:hypothetical protein DPMN_187457 [Dreissena polymorpha]